MKFYTNVAVQYNNVLVRGVHNGQRFLRKDTLSPKLFEPTNDKNATFHNLFGTPLQMVEFEDIAAARKYIASRKDVTGSDIHGNVNWQYQYITENYSGSIAFDPSLITVFAIDIETTTEHGFPNIDSPTEQVSLITICDINQKKTTTYGLFGDYSSDRENFTYKSFKTEAELFQAFLDDWNKNPPDVITGWNMSLFDIPYIVNRIAFVLGENSVKMLSPWRMVEVREVTFRNKKMTAYDLVGITQLDYLDLYQKFTQGAKESYKLDFIARLELGVGKLENPYGTFKEFYQKDWRLFVEYNITDVDRVVQLDEKMRLLELVYTMSYDAKCLYRDVFSSVRTWDCVLYNHLWDRNIVIHPRRDHRDEFDRVIEGAFVQEPIPGRYDWVVSFDATSLYPSIIMQYNMSPETLVRMPGEYKGSRRDSNNKFVARWVEEQYQAPVTVDGLVDSTFDLSHLKEKDLCMTANGYHFRQDKLGLFPEIVQKLFDDRQMYRKREMEARKLYEETGKSQYQNDISKNYNFQLARKIQLNSLFGAMANFGFRYFDDRVAEGITMTGQYIIRSVGKALNAYLDKTVGTNNYKYSFYSDTDSCYITLGPLVDKFFKGQDPHKIVGILDKICKDKIATTINDTCEKIALYTNAHNRKIVFKREAIADRGIWVAKKRYAVNVYDNEGVVYKEPKLKIMGIEIVRSSTPQAIKPMLKEAIAVAISGTESDFHSFIAKMKIEYDKLTVDDIAFPRGVNGLDKYSGVNIYASGCPLHVRGALLYNHHVKLKQLDTKYELIREGEKIKYLYLKMPNPIKENVIAYSGTLPSELNLHSYADYDIMWEKSFLDPLKNTIAGLKWTTEPKASLTSLFT